jgi:FkbM family methyltransferase
METFQSCFARVFRDRDVQVGQGRPWRVDFVGKAIEIPIAGQSAWLDWDTAVSILGHDIDVKQTYATFVDSRLRPDLFVDIGANYGTHSLLFLVHGIPTITFEPNPECNAGFRKLAAANAIEPRIEPFALGAAPGEVVLTYPARDSWLGAIGGANRDAAAAADMKSVRVQQRTLDDYAADMAGRRVLVKIDTEGYEYAVLQGATAVLKSIRPIVLFESFPDESRARLAELFHAHGYRLFGMPLRLGSPSPIDGASFAGSRATNFLAFPQEFEFDGRPG